VRAASDRTGFFTKGGIGRYAKSGGALDHASMIQMFAIFAWPKSQLHLLH
jgi:hypothetical protein